MSFVFILVIIIFSCGIIYIVNAIRGIPLTYTKKGRGEYDCISNYFWGALMVLFMLALLIDAPDYFSGKCKDGKAVVLKDLSSRRSGSFDLKFEDGEIVRVSTIFQRAAVGENIDGTLYEDMGVELDRKGRPVVDANMMTSVEGVYVAGDGAKGAATIVEAIRDAQVAVKAILGHDIVKGQPVPGTEEDCYAKKAILKESKDAANESERCLTCNKVCENCVDACPNRANISIKVPGMAMNQVIHVDYMCNECGNCKSFCPYDSAPYLDKFTLFMDENDMADSKNQGFTVLDKESVTCKVRLLGEVTTWTKGEETRIPESLQKLMETVCAEYAYLLR